MQATPSIWQRYKLRLKRRRLLWRSFRARHALKHLSGDEIPNTGVLVFSVVRNEMSRLPYFLEFYRTAGVSHFLFVDNDSNDGTGDYLKAQTDCSVWQTSAPYRDARFGLDWLTWLMMRHGHGRWCLMVDADELLVYAGDDQHSIADLSAQLDRQGYQGFGAFMLDLYPDGPLGTQTYEAGQDPREVLTHFDGAPYRAERQEPKGNLWMQGGVRERAFFAEQPERSPTLNKIPLMKWQRSFAWTNSCHAVLPRHLNFIYDGIGSQMPSGALLHTKFLPEIVEKSETERQRGQHFHAPDLFHDYYQSIQDKPNLMGANSIRYSGPDQLAELGLVSSGAWLNAE
jgi:hypothetical protein